MNNLMQIRFTVDQAHLVIGGEYSITGMGFKGNAKVISVDGKNNCMVEVQFKESYSYVLTIHGSTPDLITSDSAQWLMAIHNTVDCVLLGVK